MSNILPPLRLEGLMHEDPNPTAYSSDPSNFYKATANQDLWTETGAQFSEAAILLERVIEGVGASPDYNLSRDPTEPTDMWLIRVMKPEHEGKLLEMEDINDLLESDTKPGVRITQSPEHPSLLLAYRTVPVGEYALKAMASSPEIDKVSRIGTGHGTGMYSVYPQGTLTAVLTNPAFGMKTAEEAVRAILTM